MPTLVVAVVCGDSALAQAPATSKPAFDWLHTQQVAVPMAPDSSQSLHVSLTTPANGSAPASVFGVSSASVNGLRAFGRAPFTFDAQVGYDPLFPNTLATFGSASGSSESWKALLGYRWGALNLKAGVNQFSTGSPTLGDGSRAAAMNTFDGAEFDGSYTVSPTLRLRMGGQFYDGRANVGQQSVLGASDHMNRANLGVSYGLVHKSSLELGYEWVQWDLSNSQGALNAPGKPTEQYITIGVGQNVNKNAAFKLLYQVIDYKDKGTGFTSSNLPNSEGGAVVGQATIKF